MAKKNLHMKNPSAKDFGVRAYTTDKEYRSAKRQNRRLRDLKKLALLKRNPDKLPIDIGTCWMCWIDLTGEGLNDWRKEPYSEMKGHDPECPLCGYHHWKGRIWYPLKYKQNWIGNPSSRYGIKDGK